MTGEKRRREEDEVASTRNRGGPSARLEEKETTLPESSLLSSSAPSSFTLTPTITISSPPRDPSNYKSPDLLAHEESEIQDVDIVGQPSGDEKEVVATLAVESISDHDCEGTGQDALYGMIHQVKCRRIESITDLETNIQDNDYVPLTLEYDSGAYVVATEKGQRIGIVNCKVGLAMAALQGSRVSFGAYAGACDILESPGPSIKQGKKRSFLIIHINVCGVSDAALDAGKLLSRHGIFLQDPLWKVDSMAYSNPQILALPMISPDDTSVEIKESSTRKDWLLVLDALHQHHTTTHDDSCDVLTVPLLSHQIDGKDFMLRRETNDLEETFMLWELSTSSENYPVYRHVVTGSEVVSIPNEPCGGILADDMGLGKTLTSISVVASSVNRAEKFASFTSVGNELTRTKATLVVAPSMLIVEGWATELKSKTKAGALRVQKYHGQERARHFTEFLNCDIVLTTYGTVTTEFRRKTARHALYHIHWFRIVLDEAHTIRSQHTRQFKAITALEAKHRWCLTGTPIANRIDDLGALLRFCRIPELEDPAIFREHVTKPSKRSFALGCRALQRTLAPLCLRRTKALLNLPAPILVHCQVNFTAPESYAYEQMRLSCRRRLEMLVSGKFKAKHHTVLQTILGLRRLCNHGTLLPVQCDDLEHENLDPDEALTLIQEFDEAFCVSCGAEVALIYQLDDPDSGTVLVCGHILCRPCLSGELEQSQTTQCPCCEQQTQQALPSSAAAVALPETESLLSSKLNKVVENLLGTQSTEKSLVFSVWKKTIDLTSQLCTRHGVTHVCIDGTTQQVERRARLDRFTNDPTVSALLMTLGTGALGLTLTAATQIHIIEPQWNPTVEEQAIGRAVRLGQRRKTTVIRYTVKNTVEEQIQGYQKRKIQLAAGGFGESSEAQTEAEMKLLTASFLNQIA